jgi:hypothetical protein
MFAVMLLKGAGDGADTGQHDGPEDKARQQNYGPDIAAAPLHF